MVAGVPVRVRLLRDSRGSSFPWSNCLLVDTGRVRVLVDAGCCDALPGLGRVDAVIYTHYHPDHIRCQGLVPGSPTAYAPAQEEPYSGASVERLAARFAPGAWREWVSMARGLMGITRAPEASEYYAPGEGLRIGDLFVETIPAPGHLQSHTLLLLPDGTLHLTDIDLTRFGPWFGNPESDLAQFIADIRAAKRLIEEGAASRATTGHRPELLPAETAVAELEAYEARLWERTSRILGELRAAGRPLEPGDLVGRGIFYKNYIPGYEAVMAYFEGVMIAKTLALLEVAGCAARRRQGYTPLPGCRQPLPGPAHA